MVKAIAIVTLFGGMACADEAADRVAITRAIAASARADAKVADLLTTDFDGELVKLPAARPWCELDCPKLTFGAVRFITPDVALVEGTATGDGVAPGSGFIAILKRVGDGWRIASMRRVVVRSPFARVMPGVSMDSTLGAEFVDFVGILPCELSEVRR